jgi:hypothetical protein
MKHEIPGQSATGGQAGPVRLLIAEDCASDLARWRSSSRDPKYVSRIRMSKRGRGYSPTALARLVREVLNRAPQTTPA